MLVANTETSCEGHQTLCLLQVKIKLSTRLQHKIGPGPWRHGAPDTSGSRSGCILPSAACMACRHRPMRLLMAAWQGWRLWTHLVESSQGYLTQRAAAAMAHFAATTRFTTLFRADDHNRSRIVQMLPRMACEARFCYAPQATCGIAPQRCCSQASPLGDCGTRSKNSVHGAPITTSCCTISRPYAACRQSGMREPPHLIRAAAVHALRHATRFDAAPAFRKGKRPT